mgnify:CR=1 FL=1
MPQVVVDASSALRGLDRFSNRMEVEIKDAVDRTAAFVVNHAKGGHPKATAGGGNKDDERERTGPEGGDYAGGLRFLTRLGNLRNSYKQRAAKKIESGVRADVFSAIEYSEEIEFGTVTRRAFPTLRPALEAARPEGKANVERALKRALGTT